MLIYLELKCLGHLEKDVIFFHALLPTMVMGNKIYIISSDDFYLPLAYFSGWSPFSFVIPGFKSS